MGGLEAVGEPDDTRDIGLIWKLLNPQGKVPFRILCLGAHCDDIEIGCGGTVLRILREEERRGVSIRWVVFSSDLKREKEARGSASEFLDGASDKEIVIKNFRNGFWNRT